MKRIFVVFLFLALVLTACGPAPTPVTIIITATDAPVVATDVPAPTDAPEPTDEPAPTDEPEPTDEPAPTDAPEPTDEPAPTETAEPGVAPTNTRPPAVGGAVFTDITYDVDAFSLKCSPSQVNFSLKIINKAITSVYLYYRVIDKDSTVAAGTFVSGGEMIGEKDVFTREFSALDVNPDLRLANGWFDFQFVGVNKYGDVVGRSDKIVKQITFTLECP